MLPSSLRSLSLALLLAGGYASALVPEEGDPAAGAAGQARPDPRLSPNRIARISASFFGMPYGRDARARPRRVDCQTYVEQVMARVLAADEDEFVRTLNRIRYRNGVVKEEERLVYCIPDWLEVPWPARDVTGEVAEVEFRYMTRVIDRALFFRRTELAHRGGRFAPQRVETPFIPRSAAMGLPYPDGSIAVFVQRRAGIVAAHCGFLFQREGRTVLRHASQTRGAVVQEPLEAFLQRAPAYVIGLKVLAPDTSRWED